MAVKSAATPIDVTYLRHCFKYYWRYEQAIVAVYVTGGDEYSSVQAMNGSDPFGKKGVNEEYLFDH